MLVDAWDLVEEDEQRIAAVGELPRYLASFQGARAKRSGLRFGEEVDDGEWVDDET